MSLRRNTLWNLVGGGAPFLLGAVTIPYLIHHIGVEAFGILTLIWGLIGYFSLFDFGLGRALTQRVAANRATGQVDQLSSLIKTGLLFTLATGTIGGVILAIIAKPLGYKWLKVSVSLQPITVYSLLIASFGILPTAITTGLRGILEAYEDFKASNMLRMMLGAANFAFPVLSVILFGTSLAMIVFSLIAARLAILGAHMYLVYKKLPLGCIQAKFNRKKMGELLSFGSWITVSNVVGSLMVVVDRFIIASVLGASLVAYYTVPSDLLIRILIIPGALAGALFPRLTTVMISDRTAVKRVYEKSLKITTLIMLPICLSIAIFSHWGLSLWLGENFASHSWKIASILVLGVLLNGIAQVPFAAIQASGNPQITAILHLTEFLFYIPLLFALLHFFGLIGASIIWVIRNGADLIILVVYARRCISSVVGLQNTDKSFLQQGWPSVEQK